VSTSISGAVAGEATEWHTKLENIHKSINTLPHLGTLLHM